MRCAGLFAGIGGMELGLASAGHQLEMLCEISPVAQVVLRKHFPDVDLEPDITQLDRLPDVDVVTAGFPCQDLSQAGTGKGLRGKNSGLVREVFRLLGATRRKPTWLIFENVPFMLSLKRGAAISYLVDSLEQLGYSWAYRIVDARCFGVPQRRRRVLILASRSKDPRPVLLGQDHGMVERRSRWDNGRGFYWTEGNRGLGWAPDAVPTLKGGSGLGIASPPAIWLPAGRSMEVPSLRDGERLQGFAADWTAAVESDFGSRERWRLIGNAVCVPMMEWLSHRLNVVERHSKALDVDWEARDGWPAAAWGHKGIRSASKASAWPMLCPATSIISFLRYRTKPLSFRATHGFLTRARASRLRFEAGFLEDVAYHAEVMRAVQ